MATFPTTIALPVGFRPESIVIDDGGTAYLGSVGDGSIYAFDLADGSGRTVIAGNGSPSGGIKLDGERLFVAGGFAGDARVLDLHTGSVLAGYQLAAGRAALVADVVLTPGAAWFTDAFFPCLYKVPFGTGGELPDRSEVREIPLTGDVQYKEGDYNVGGIARTPDGKALLIAQANTGGLFRVDPATGHAETVDLDGHALVSVDGLAMAGTTMYAGLGMVDVVAIVELSPDGSSGRVVQRITHSGFDIPTSVFPFQDRLYVVNSQLDGRSVDPAAEYTVVAVPRP